MQEGDVMSGNLNKLLKFLSSSFHRVMQVWTFWSRRDDILHFELGFRRGSPHGFNRCARFNSHIDHRLRFLPSIWQRRRRRGRWCTFCGSWRGWRKFAVVFYKLCCLAGRSSVGRAKRIASCFNEIPQRTWNGKGQGAFVIEEGHHVQVERTLVALEEGICDVVEALLCHVPRHSSLTLE